MVCFCWFGLSVCFDGLLVGLFCWLVWLACLVGLFGWFDVEE